MSKEDMLAALQHRQPPKAVPRWEISFHLFDAFSGKRLILGEEFEKLSSPAQQKTLEENADILLSVSEQLSFSGLTIPTGFWHEAPGQLAYYILPQEARLRLTELLAKRAGSKLLLIAGVPSIMVANYDEDYCAKLFESPEEIDELARQRVANGIEQARRFRDAGAGAVVSSSDIADNSGPFYNPGQMQRFILPYLAQWAQQCRDMGLPTIMHSDGQLTPCLEGIANSGINGLQAIDPVAGMDIVAAQKQVGKRLCLCGNVDCGLLLRATPEQVYQVTTDLLRACKPDGFVLGASNAMQREVPRENYLALHQAWKDHGKY